MKTTYSIAVIAMFAVTLGLGLMSPALATQPDADGEHKTLLCHYQEAETITNDDGSTTVIPAEWALIDVDNKGKMNGHFDKNGDTRHFDVEPVDGDFVINNDDEDDTNDLQSCLDLLPVEEEV
jgi:hypothetical protein